MKSGCTVFLAEDRRDDADLVRWALKNVSDCALEVVHDGEEAKAWLLGTASSFATGGGTLPAVVLLDLKLTKIGGLELLQLIRLQPALRRIPVVVYSTSQHQAEIDAAYDAGASAFVVKPETHDELMRVMRSLADFWLGTAKLPSAPAPSEARRTVFTPIGPDGAKDVVSP